MFEHGGGSVVYRSPYVSATLAEVTQRPKRRDSQRDSDQNCARTEDVLAITVRQEFLFRRKVGCNSTENKAILEQTLSISTLHCNLIALFLESRQP